MRQVGQLGQDQVAFTVFQTAFAVDRLYEYLPPVGTLDFCRPRERGGITNVEAACGCD